MLQKLRTPRLCFGSMGKGAMTDKAMWTKAKGFRMSAWYFPSLPYGE